MKNKLWVCFLIFLSGFCAFFFNYAYEDAKKTAIKDLNEKQLSYARQTGIGIEDFFKHWTNLLNAISHVDGVANLNETGRKYLSFTYETNKGDITTVTRVDARGKIVFTVPFSPNAIGQDISGQKHVQEVMRSHKPVVSDVFKAVQGFDMVALHVPVLNNGIYQGTIAIGINFQNLAKRYIEGIRIGNTGYAWMISRDGKELYCPVPGHTGNSVYENCKKYPEIIAMAEEMVKGKQGVTTYTFDQIRDRNVELVKKHAVYMPIHVGQTFWSIVVASSESEVLSSLEGFRNSLFVIMGSFLVGGAIFSFFGLKGWFLVREEEKRLKAEEALQETQRRLADIIEFLPDATLVIDRDGKVIAWNLAIESMTGVRSEEMLGKGNYEYALPFYGERKPILIDLALHPDPEREKSYTTIQRKGDIVIGEAYTPALVPGNVHLSATASVLRDSRGEIIAAIECIRNNTDRKNMEERLQRAEKMEALGVLAGGVAHDMNNILGVLVGYSELLLREIPEEGRAAKYARNILQGSERAAAIIQDLLTLARRGVSVSETVNLNRIVTDFLDSPEFDHVKLHHPDVLFRSQLETALFNIKGSPVHLFKTVMNLLANAAESIRGVGEVAIMTESRYVDVPIPGYENTQEGEYVVLTISDTGSGISPADLGHIFEPFYTKKVMARSGTGLGLAVVWGTVKDHGGYIDVRSEENKGSTFTLYFPASREALSKKDKDLSPDSYQGRGESILIVDDVEAQRTLAATILENLNYRVATARSGEEAVKYLRENKTDLIVLDMIMDPGIDGLETYRRILEIQRRQKAIIVSGFAKTDRVRAAQELGAGEYVKKPYVIEKLGMAVRNELDS
jgi:PAS domain S-box-containing protein